MQSKRFGALALVSALLLFTAATAQAQPGRFQTGHFYTGRFYIGVAGGSSNIDTRVTTVTAHLDESSTGYKIYGGYDLSRNFAVEFAYADLGEGKLTGNNGDRFIRDNVLYQFTANNAELKFNPTLISAAGVFTARVGRRFDLHGRIGVASWNVDYTASATGVPGSTGSDSGSDIFFGGGVGLHFGWGWRLTADYESYSIDNGDSTLLSIGLAKSF